MQIIIERNENSTRFYFQVDFGNQQVNVCQ